MDENGNKKWSDAEPILKCRDMTKVWSDLGSSVTAVRHLSFDVSPREILAIIGPSGCGKTTTLNVLSGLEASTSGYVSLNGLPVAAPTPDCVLVSQEPALFPWLTAQKNVEFPLRLRRFGKEERKRRAEEIIHRVGLTDFAGAFPHQLSSGMQQRIAIACSLVVEPKVVLMDEPFGALDAQTRFLMQQFLLQVWQMTHKTIVLVTHQIDEALFLADRVIVMTARPATIKKEIVVELDRPRDRFSNEFNALRKEVFELLSDEVRFE